MCAVGFVPLQEECVHVSAQVAMPAAISWEPEGGGDATATGEGVSECSGGIVGPAMIHGYQPYLASPDLRQ